MVLTRRLAAETLARRRSRRHTRGKRRRIEGDVNNTTDDSESNSGETESSVTNTESFRSKRIYYRPINGRRVAATPRIRSESPSDLSSAITTDEDEDMKDLHAEINNSRSNFGEKEAGNAPTKASDASTNKPSTRIYTRRLRRRTSSPIGDQTGEKFQQQHSEQAAAETDTTNEGDDEGAASDTSMASAKPRYMIRRSRFRHAPPQSSAMASQLQPQPQMVVENNVTTTTTAEVEKKKKLPPAISIPPNKLGQQLQPVHLAEAAAAALPTGTTTTTTPPPPPTAAAAAEVSSTASTPTSTTGPQRRRRRFHHHHHHHNDLLETTSSDEHAARRTPTNFDSAARHLRSRKLDVSQRIPLLREDNFNELKQLLLHDSTNVQYDEESLRSLLQEPPVQQQQAQQQAQQPSSPSAVASTSPSGDANKSAPGVPAVEAGQEQESSSTVVEIPIPSFREIKQGYTGEKFERPHAYIRHYEKSTEEWMYITEYEMDSEDEAFVDKMQRKAAAMQATTTTTAATTTTTTTPQKKDKLQDKVMTRRQRQARNAQLSNNGGEPPREEEIKLNYDTYERIMDRLEKEYYALKNHDGANLTGGLKLDDESLYQQTYFNILRYHHNGEYKLGREQPNRSNNNNNNNNNDYLASPDRPGGGRNSASDDNIAIIITEHDIRLVYERWVEKRRKYGRKKTLIPRLMQHEVTEMELRERGEFGRRRRGRPPMERERDSIEKLLEDYVKMLQIRRDLEKTRLLVDLVKKREMLKRKLVQNSASLLEAKLEQFHSAAAGGDGDGDGSDILDTTTTSTTKATKAAKALKSRRRQHGHSILLRRKR